MKTEVEAKFLDIDSEAIVRAAAAKLGFDWDAALFGGVARIYKNYFDVEYEKIDRCPELVFSPAPEWLEKARISIKK